MTIKIELSPKSITSRQSPNTFEDKKTTRFSLNNFQDLESSPSLSQEKIIILDLKRFVTARKFVRKNQIQELEQFAQEVGPDDIYGPLAWEFLDNEEELEKIQHLVSLKTQNPQKIRYKNCILTIPESSYLNIAKTIKFIELLDQVEDRMDRIQDLSTMEHKATYFLKKETQKNDSKLLEEVINLAQELKKSDSFLGNLALDILSRKCLIIDDITFGLEAAKKMDDSEVKTELIQLHEKKIFSQDVGTFLNVAFLYAAGVASFIVFQKLTSFK